jgi:DNA invertase Pin-like site-specific DNA recombinase
VSAAKKLNTTGHRIGLYIRVSTEEQASNPEGSIKNQEERLRAVVKLKNMEQAFGDIKVVYVEAKSGKDTNRSELQKLLAAIRKREINLVMVTELSRISRSVKDFSLIWELMQANNCGFYSLRENFDTTTAAGEMVLLIVATLAQFERRQISERVTANFSVRSKRGLFNGGAIPYGFKRNVDRPGYLDIDEEAANIVKNAFAAFIREGALMPAARWLNEQPTMRMKRERECGGNRKRAGFFTVDNLQAMIRNKMYIGIKVYTTGGETNETTAVWSAIVDRDTFEMANELLSRGKKLSKKDENGVNRRYPYLLSTLVSCKKCGDRLPGKSAHGRRGKVGYYEHGWAAKKGSHVPGLKHQCWPFRVPAKILEPAVWTEIEKVLDDEHVVKGIYDEALKYHKLNPGSREAEGYRQAIFSVDEKLETLSERLTSLPSTISPAPIYHQWEKLEDIKKDAQRKLAKLESSGSALDLPVGLKTYKVFREALRELLSKDASPQTKSLVARWLIRWVKIHEEGFDINWAIGDGYVKCVLASWENPRNSDEAEASEGKAAIENEEGKKKPLTREVGGSQILTSGRGDRIRTCDLLLPKQTRYQAALRPDIKFSLREGFIGYQLSRGASIRVVNSAQCAL